MAELFSNQKLNGYFRQNALRRISTQFTWSKIAHSMSNLYEKVMFEYQTPAGFHEAKLSILDESFASAIETLQKSSMVLRLPIVEAASAITQALSGDAKLLVCGNGGSASQAQHFAAELVGRFQD